MKRRSRKRKLFTDILIFLMLTAVMLSALPLIGLNSVRADTYISGRTGSIQAILISQSDSGGRQTPYSGISMKLYQVGSVSENKGTVNFTLDPCFSGSGIKIETLTNADHWASAARTLSEIAASSGVNSMEGTSDTQGQIYFDNLLQGIYLLMQSSGQDRLAISPSLLTVPLQENGQWIYDIIAYPKFTPDHANADICVTKRLYSVNEDSQLIPLSADDASFRFGLYADKEGAIPFRDDYIRTIQIQGVSSGMAVWENVPSGSYYIFELDENGNSLPVNQQIYADDENFWMYNVKDENENENNQVIVSSFGASGNMYVDNYFYYLPHGYYWNGTIKIRKNVLKDGKKITADDTFYAGIFEKDSDGNEILVSNIELEQNDTVEVSIQFPDEELPEEITYTVKETDKNGEPVNKRNFPYTVSGEGDITLKESEGYEKNVTLTNSISTVSSTVTPPANHPTQNNNYVRTDTSASVHQVSSTSIKSPKTGDDTHIISWAALLIIAAAGIVIVYKVKRKNK